MSLRAHHHLVLDELAERLAQGDRAAFRPLYTELWPLLLAFCTRALGDEQAAQDAAQEALLKVYARIGHYDRRRGHAVAWAIRIAGYECLTVRKRCKRRREHFSEPPERVSEQASPEQLAIRRDLVAAVHEQLAGLPAQQVDAIVARLTDEPPKAAVAPATFRKRLQRGLAALRRAWRAHDEMG